MVGAAGIIHLFAEANLAWRATGFKSVACLATTIEPS